MQSDEPEMSRKEFSVAYNGADRLSDHSIDIDLLAPALRALAVDPRGEQGDQRQERDGECFGCVRF